MSDLSSLLYLKSILDQELSFVSCSFLLNGEGVRGRNNISMVRLVLLKLPVAIREGKLYFQPWNYHPFYNVTSKLSILPHGKYKLPSRYAPFIIWGRLELDGSLVTFLTRVYIFFTHEMSKVLLCAMCKHFGHFMLKKISSAGSYSSPFVQLMAPTDRMYTLQRFGSSRVKNTEN